MDDDAPTKTYINSSGLELSSKSLNFNKMIVKGLDDSYPTVYVAFYNNSRVAVKLLKNVGSNSVFFENEVSALKLLSRFEYIVDFIDTIHSTDQSYFGIITDWHNENLFEYIQTNSIFDEKKASIIMFQLLSSIRCIHQQFLVHRNINLTHILITNNDHDYQNIRLTGLSFTATISEDNSLHQKLGNPLFWAPEIVRDESYSCPVDIWAAGLIMYYILTGFVPFNPSDQNEMFQQIVNGITLDSFPKTPQISEEAKDLIVKMMNTNPNQRITADEALHHKWIKDNFVSFGEFMIKKNMKLYMHFRDFEF